MVTHRTRTWVLFACVVVFTGQVLASTAHAATVFITGSNRGIGFELTQQFAARGWDVIATCRDPQNADDLKSLVRDNSNVVIEELDVTDDEEIDDLAEKYRGTPIDLLINNAGINGGIQSQIFGRLDYDMFDRIMAVNVRGPLRITEAFTEHVAASDQKKMITITSSEGSIASVRFPAFYFYRASKAAVNMIMATIAPDLARRGIIVGLINPGVVDTDMSRGAPIPLLSPEESVSGMIDVIEDYSPKTSGKFMQWDGRELPW